MATALTSDGKTLREMSDVAGTSNGWRGQKKTQFIKDVSIHTFPNERSKFLRHFLIIQI